MRSEWLHREGQGSSGPGRLREVVGSLSRLAGLCWGSGSCHAFSTDDCAAADQNGLVWAGGAGMWEATTAGQAKLMVVSSARAGSGRSWREMQIVGKSWGSGRGEARW